MTDRLGVAVVGCGRIGARRAAVAAAHGRTQLQVVVDVSEEAARGLAAAQGCRWSVDWPTVVADPEGEIAAVYRQVARKVAVKIAQKSKDFSAKFPTITVSKDT